AVAEAQSALDAMAAAWRAGTGAPGRVDQAKVDQAKAALAQARERVMQQQAALERLQADATMPLPTATEGQYTSARQEMEAARARCSRKGSCAHRPISPCCRSTPSPARWRRRRRVRR